MLLFRLGVILATTSLVIGTVGMLLFKFTDAPAAQEGASYHRRVLAQRFQGMREARVVLWFVPVGILMMIIGAIVDSLH